MQLCHTRTPQFLNRRAPQALAPLLLCAPVRRVTAHAAAPPSTIGLGGGIVTDAAVPEGHKGLHGFLYGTGGAEEHENAAGYELRKGEDDGSIIQPVPQYLSSRDGEKPLGVYLLYNEQQQPQYLGFSRNMVLALKGHLARVGPERCAYVRAMVFANRAMSSRANLEREAAHWLQDKCAGVTPPGNKTGPNGRDLWDGVTPAGASAAAAENADGAGLASLDTSHMSPAERAAYEERKLKMRKAMGEKLGAGAGGGAAGEGHEHDHDHEQEGEDDPATRRLRMIAAMNRGDWSSVIDAQTKEALASADADAGGSATEGAGGSTDGEGTEASMDGGEGAAARSSTASQDGGQIVSPFAREAAGGGGAAARARPRAELTVAAVQTALEEVRPYLMADGGDVEVVEVSGSVVYLRLQGACTSCPSQSATMKGGIERVIRTTFGEHVDVMQVDSKEPSASVEMLDAHLNMLRGAINNLGGSVQVVSVEGGVATLRYKGPPSIGKGVAGALKDTFKDLKEVLLVD